jgi:hypothetical protein
MQATIGLYPSLNTDLASCLAPNQMGRLYHGQTLAAFRPARLKHVLTTSALHAMEKAMLSLARNFFRLICPFWHFFSSVYAFWVGSACPLASAAVSDGTACTGATVGEGGGVKFSGGTCPWRWICSGTKGSRAT